MGRKMVDCMNLPKGIYVSALFLYKYLRGNSYTVYKREKLEISVEHFCNMINFYDILSENTFCIKVFKK